MENNVFSVFWCDWGTMTDFKKASLCIQLYNYLTSHNSSETFLPLVSTFCRMFFYPGLEVSSLVAFTYKWEFIWNRVYYYFKMSCYLIQLLHLKGRNHSLVTIASFGQVKQIWRMKVLYFVNFPNYLDMFIGSILWTHRI